MVGQVDPGILAELSHALDEALGLEVRPGPRLPIPADAWQPVRRQYDAARMLRDVAAAFPAGAAKILALTEVDLFHPILTFLYGQAQLGGSAALVSLARLRQDFYGLPPQPALAVRRLRKEALHELGHTFGLTHCRDSSCAMALSTSLDQLDVKNDSFCHTCRLALTQEVIA
jgi:archaemetzincin